MPRNVRKSPGKSTVRKSPGKSTVRKSPGKSPSPKIFFHALYESKPNIDIRNPKIKCENLKLGLDDDDEWWLLMGNTNSSTLTKVKTWLRSLGTIKKVHGKYGKQLLEVGY